MNSPTPTPIPSGSSTTKSTSSESTEPTDVQLREWNLRNDSQVIYNKLQYDRSLSPEQRDFLTSQLCLIDEELQTYTDYSKVMLKISFFLNDLKRILLSDNLSTEFGRLRAVGFLEKAESRAKENSSYGHYVSQWIANGDIKILKSIILEPLGYDNDRLLDFSAFALIDELRDNLNGKAVVTKRRKEQSHG